VLFNNYQKAARTGVVMGYATQAYAQYKINKAVKTLMEVNGDLADKANQSVYLVMYLMAKLLEHEVEFDMFDLQVLNDPPKMFDPELPNMFQEFFLQFSKGEEPTDEQIHEFMEKLKAVRQGEDDDA